jgi:hypothetical protein
MLGARFWVLGGWEAGKLGSPKEKEIEIRKEERVRIWESVSRCWEAGRLKSRGQKSEVGRARLSLERWNNMEGVHI